MAIEGDLLPAGKSDNLPYSKVDPAQLAMGAKVEMEHTNRKALAKEIAKDHLAEIPDYYTRLKKMEAAAEAQGEKQAMAPDHPYLLDQVGKLKVRKLSALPPEKNLRTVKTAAFFDELAKQAAATGVYGLPLERDPMEGKQKSQASKRLAQSQKVGVSPFKEPKLKPLNIKIGAAWGPSMQRIALGAGLGVAGGAAAGAAGAGEGHRLRGAVLGGLGGGAVGAGAGYVAPRYMSGRAGGLSRGEAVQAVGQDIRAHAGAALQQRGQQMQQNVLREQRPPVRRVAPVAAAQPTVGAAAHSPAMAAAPEAATAARPVVHTGSPTPPPAARTPITPPTGYVPQELPPPVRPQTVASAPMGHQKAASAKLAQFPESQYSGGTSIGGQLTYTNIIPPFKNPPVKTAGPPPPTKKAEITKMGAMRDELMKLNAVNAITIGGRAAQARKVGQPKTTAPPGPSIGDIAKPVGYGEKIPGATKTGAVLPKAAA